VLGKGFSYTNPTIADRIDGNQTSQKGWEAWRGAIGTAKTTILQRDEESPNPKSLAQYQVVVGGLLFIARMTRPEISIHVNLLGRRIKDASPTNYQTALGVLRYLHSTSSDGLILRKADDLKNRIYTDACYGGDEARSQAGVLMTLGNQLVGWYSRRQDVVSLSADCKGAKDAACMQQFLEELGIVTTRTLYTDKLNRSQRAKDPKMGSPKMA